MKTETHRPVSVVETTEHRPESEFNRLLDKKSVFEPKNISEAFQLAEYMAKSSLVPKQYVGKPADIIIAMQFGEEFGLKPHQALQGIGVVNGRPQLFGPIALAVVQRHPDFIDSDEKFNASTNTATVTMKRRGRTPVTKSFSMKDAETAKLNVKDTYRLYAQDMLMWRARHRCITALFPDIAAGIAGVSEHEYEAGEGDLAEEFDPETGEIPAPVPAPILMQINNAESIESLEQLLAQLKALPDTDKPAARDAYAAKMRELSAPADVPEHLADWLRDLKEVRAADGLDAALEQLHQADDLTRADKDFIKGKLS